jgi:long-chain fatty acid transport protein
MKRSLKLTVAVALAIGSTSVYATNGVNLIGTGAQSRGMGGVGIGMPWGAESGLPNTALISSVEDTEVSFGGTFFMPNVKTDGGNTNPAFGGKEEKSEADMFVVPEVGFAMKATENFYWGIGMWGASGLGVDYRDATNNGTSQLVTNYQALQLAVPLTGKFGGFSIGIAPVLHYGALDTQWNTSYDPVTGAPTSSVGAGVSQDLSFGANLGLAYQTGGFTFGAVYKSGIKMEYKGQPALNPAIVGGLGIELDENRLDVPAEYGIGFSYAFAGNHTVALDAKTIKYGDTKGWKEFGWKNQNVVALGYQFATPVWAVRAGYNYGKAPIENLSVSDPTNGNPGRNYFNAVGFPATVEQHLTVGGSYYFSKKMGVDVAFTYAPEKKTEYDSFDPAFNPVVVTTKHSQTALTVGMNFKF